MIYNKDMLFTSTNISIPISLLCNGDLPQYIWFFQERQD